jgi:HK97 family phage portal protein
MKFGFKKKKNVRQADAGTVAEGDNNGVGNLLRGVSSREALNLSTVYRCVEILSNSVAQLPVRPYQVSNGNKRIMREHPTYRVLNNPSRNLSKYMFFKMLVQDMLLKGNGYAYIDRDVDNRVLGLIYIPAEFVAINWDLNLFHDVTYIVYGLDRIIEHTDMIHIVNFSSDGVHGVSTIHYGAQSMQIASESESMANEALKSNVTGLLSVESMLSDQQTKAAKAAWNANIREKGGIAVLSGGWKFQPVTLNAHDAQLIESRKFNSIDISRWFGVPTTKLGINDGVSYNGYDAEQLMFLSDTLSPLLQKIEIELERKLYSKVEQEFIDVKFDISNILRTDMKSRAEYFRTLSNIGVLTINEIRNQLDLPNIEHGDKAFLQSNITTVEQIATPQQPQPPIT